MTRRLPAAMVLLALMLSACAVAASPGPSGGTSPTPGATGPTPAASAGPNATVTTALSDADLKIRLIDRFGPLWYCDPDIYPVARTDEQAQAVQRWPEVAADAAAQAAIARHLGIGLTPAPTDAQKLAIYREWKVLRAIALEGAGAGRSAFDYLAMPAPGGRDGTRSTGTIDRSGTITVGSSEAAPEPMCPICLARGQRIDTPLGPIPVESLRLGDAVWTLDDDGVRTAAVVVALGSAATPPRHEMVRLVLADGRTVLASPGHSLADGRELGSVRPGDRVEGAIVLGAEHLTYEQPETFDLLPSGPTGRYAIDGIWLASTLRP